MSREARYHGKKVEKFFSTFVFDARNNLENMTCTFGHKLRRKVCHNSRRGREATRNEKCHVSSAKTTWKKFKTREGKRELEKLTITHLYHILVAAVELQTNISTITERERGDSEF